MAPEASSVSFIRRLLEGAGWSVEAMPSGWRAREPGPPQRVLLFFREPDLPAGFQRHFPSDHGPAWVLLDHAPTPHEVDRLELAGAQPLELEAAATTLLELLRPTARPPEEVTVDADPASVLPHREPHKGPSPSAAAAPPKETHSPEPPPPPERTLPSSWSEEQPYGSASPSATSLRQDPVPFPPQVFESERIIKPRLLEEDLQRMAVGRWRGGTPKLFLVPFYLFAYALPEDDEASGAPPRLVAVPAVGGPAQFWAPGEREITSAIGHPHHRPRHRLSREQARDLAIEAIRARHARLEERAEQRRGMLEIENRRRPRALEEVRLGPPAWVWVPHWVVDAWNGHEVLDAVTGLPADIPLEGSDLPS
jgi:hypothetical protein